MRKQKLIQLVKERLLREIGHRVFPGEPEFDRGRRQWRVPLLCNVDLRRHPGGQLVQVGTAVLDKRLSFIEFPTREQVLAASPATLPVEQDQWMAYALHANARLTRYQDAPDIGFLMLAQLERQIEVALGTLAQGLRAYEPAVARVVEWLAPDLDLLRRLPQLTRTVLGPPRLWRELAAPELYRVPSGRPARELIRAVFDQLRLEDRHYAIGLGPEDVEGPETEPFCFTALRQPPASLRWEGDPRAHYQVVLLYAVDRPLTPRPLRTVGPWVDLAAAGVQFEPDMIYDWQIWPAEGAADLPLARGRFRVLRPDLVERLAATEAACQAIGHPILRAVALAALWEQADPVAGYLPGLHDEAVRLLGEAIFSHPVSAETLPAHRALAALYHQIGALVGELHWFREQAWLRTRANAHVCAIYDLLGRVAEHR